MKYTTKKNSNKKKWNRVHFFVKEDKSKVNQDKEKTKAKEHPAFVFEQSKTHYKAIHFTTHPTTNGKPNVPLVHNIDPDDTVRQSYAVPYGEPRPQREYKKPDKNYRIHKDDVATIKQMKNKKRR